MMQKDRGQKEDVISTIRGELFKEEGEKKLCFRIWNRGAGARKSISNVEIVEFRKKWWEFWKR